MGTAEGTDNNDKSVINTKDTYEVAFYMMYGGIIDKVSVRTLKPGKARKKGYIDQWIITVSNVPKWVIDTWKTEQAYGNITEFVNVRTKLKKNIKRDFEKY